jgi:hypothetical protein
MSTANLDSAKLKAASGGGLIREDVMNKIWDISKIPLPFTDLVGSTTAKQEFIEWTQDSLQKPNIANAVIDGSDASGNETVVGVRVGNHHQISSKVVRVSYRAEASDVIGQQNPLGYQLIRRQQELRRDVEAMALNNQASQADDGNSKPGIAGGLPAWLATSHFGGAGSKAGGFDAATRLVKARTVGTARALSETDIRDAIQSVYEQGGDPSVMMSVPGVIAKFSQFMIASGGATAPITSWIDKGDSKSPATALGAVNVFVTDFGTIRAVPNRLQPKYKAGTVDGCADVFILDPQYTQLCYMKGYQTQELATTGLADNRQISVDWSLIVNTEKAHAIVGDIDPSKDMVK